MSMPANIRISRKSMNKYNKMVDEVRQYLLGVCEEKTNRRWRAWVNIVRKGIKKINIELFDQNDVDDEKACIPPKFNRKLSKKQMENITEFIVKWKGLKVEKKNRPKGIKQYRIKALSWLNGRRAKQYGDHLYPSMFKKAHKFVKELAENYFMSKLETLEGYENIQNDMTKINNLKELYVKILMALFIVELCEKNMALNPRAKKVYLLCPNSFKSQNSKTRDALQRFADKEDEGCKEMRYYNKFPEHRTIAIDYFKGKWKSSLKKLLNEINDIGHIAENDNGFPEILEKVMAGIRKTAYNGKVTVPKFIIDLKNIYEKEDKKNKRNIIELQQKIKWLEDTNNEYVSHQVIPDPSLPPLPMETDDCDDSKERNKDIEQSQSYNQNVAHPVYRDPPKPPLPLPRNHNIPRSEWQSPPNHNIIIPPHIMPMETEDYHNSLQPNDNTSILNTVLFIPPSGCSPMPPTDDRQETETVITNAFNQPPGWSPAPQSFIFNMQNCNASTSVFSLPNYYFC